MTSPFAPLLPGREQTMLLAACLLDGPDARRAWREFVGLVGDAKTYFERNHTGLKGLLPFVEARLCANDIDAGKSFHTYARVALVREELRSKILAGVLDEIVAAAHARDIPLVLLKGAAVSATAYPQPSTRHIHAIDLLVDPAHWSGATALLSALRFTADRLPQPGKSQHQGFHHHTGLALGLHISAFFLPYFRMPPEALGANLRTLELGAGAVKVLSPEAALVHIGGHAFYSRHRPNLRWACDMVLLIRRNPNLDWRLLTDLADRAGLALALCTQLKWLNETFCAVPARTLSELEERSGRRLGAREGIYASLLHTTQSRRQACAAFAGDWRDTLGFLKFSVAPSVSYMRWKHNVDGGWQLAVRYADRPRRLAARMTTARGAT